MLMPHQQNQLRSFSPHGTLLLLLAAATAILIGGGRLAKRTERVRVVGDRAPVQALAGGMEKELGRLERLYENHLDQLAKTTESLGDDHQGIWQQCKRIIGVSQWSLIHRDTTGGPDIHLPIDVARSRSLPVPTLRANEEGLPHEKVLLSAEELFQPGADASGWIDEPDKPLLFWRRVKEDSAMVLLIDRAPILANLEQWFTQWTDNAFAPLRAAKERVAVTSPSGRAIATLGTAPDAGPDFLLPLRSPFGTWQIAAWDRVETCTVYDAHTQAATLALAVLVALLGIFGFVQQRRMLAIAAQRVSFVNRVSHELRTPLTNILLNLDLVTDALGEGPDAGEPARRLALVSEEAQRLGRLIENVLAFSRGESGQLRPHPRACVPDGIVEAIVQQFAPLFARRDLSIRVTGGVATACLLDADALAQILSNLLSNVEKYVPTGVVEIALQLKNDMLLLTVTDHGPGIPAPAAERVFRPFERLQCRINEGSSGTGLGLSIARDLARSAGGSLRLVPSAAGASFELLLPAPPAPSPRAISA
jgi:signal transduction histidine kinase